MACAVMLSLLAADPVAAEDARDKKLGTLSGLLIKQLGKATGLKFAVAKVDGSLLGALTLHDVTVADKKGALARVRRIRLDWSPRGLFAGSIVIKELSVSDVTLLRIPSKPPADAPPLDLSFLRLDFGAPISVWIRTLRFERISYAPGIFGKAGQFILQGRAFVPRDKSSVDIDLRLQRLQGAAPEGKILVKLDKKTKQLRVDVDLGEAAGGVLGAQLGLKSDSAVRFRFVGAAPVNDWQGRLTLEAGAEHRLRLAIRSQTGPVAGTPDIGDKDANHNVRRTRVRVTGDVRSAAMGRALPWLGPRMDVDFDGYWGRQIAIRSLRVVGSGADVLLAGQYQPDSNQAQLSLTAVVDRLALLGDQLGMPLRGRGLISAGVTGNIAAPRIDATITADRLRMGPLVAAEALVGVRAQALSADRKTGGDLKFTVRATDASLMGPTGTLTPLGPLSLKLDGQQSRQADSWGKIALVAAFGQSKLNARADIANLSPFKGAGQVDFSGSLPPALLQGGRLEQARLSATLSLDQAARAGQAQLRANAAKIASGVTAIDAILKGQARIQFDGNWSGQKLAIKILDLTAGQVRLTGRGGLSDRAADKLTVRLNVPELADLRAALGRDLAGRANLDGTVWRGPNGLAADIILAAQRLSLDRRRLDALKLSLVGRQLDGDPAVRIRGKMTGGVLRGTLNSRVAIAADRWQIKDLRAVTNAGWVRADLSGASGLVRGTVQASLRRLSPILQLLGQPGRGAVQLRARLTDRAGRQGLNLRVTGRGIRSGAGKNAPTIGALSARLNFAALQRAPMAVRGTVAASRIKAGPAKVQNLRLVLTPAGRGSRYRLSSKAIVNNRRASLQTQGRMAPVGAALRLIVATLKARFGPEKLTLAKPTALVIGPAGALRMRQTSLNIAGGTVAVRMTSQGAYRDVRIGLTKLPGRLLRYANIGRIDKGVLNGTVRLRGAGADLIDFDVKATGLQRRGASAALSLTAKGRKTPARTKADVTLAATGSKDVLAIALVLPRRGGIAATIKGRADLATLTQSGLLVNQQMSGRVIADLKISGTDAAPTARGSLRLQNGRFVNAQSGAILDKLSVLVEGQGNRLLIRNATATDGGQGRLQVTGSAALGKQIGYTYALKIKASQFRVVRREQARVKIDATLAVRSKQAAGIDLGGDIKVLDARIGLAEKLPASLNVIDVVEINTPLDLKRLAATRASPLPPPPVRFDLKIQVPNRFFISGRGVSAEFAGRLALTGTAAAPRIQGGLKTVRGHVDLLGRRFKFEKGDIQFATRDLSNPTLDFRAVADTGDLRGIVTIKGTAKKPVINITSDPVLPRDEVLARILFGKDVTKLTGIEALRLAAGAATLFGSGGTDVTERLRRATGLDVIDITSEGGSTRAVLGKYVSERVLIKVEQGLELDNTAVGTEVRIFRNLSGEATVRSDGSARGGLKWSLDY